MVQLDALRLTTWKEIAAYLRRDERTAKRWEVTRGLPVRRPPGAGRGTVFAYPAEIDSWLVSADVAAEATDTSPMVRAAGGARRWLAVAAGLAAVVAAGAVVVWRAGEGPSHPPGVQAQVPEPELYSRGLYAFHTRTATGLNEAIADFSKLLAKDPTYAPAYAALADCYNLMPEYAGMPAAQAYTQAEVAAKRALALDEKLADAHRALAFVDFWWDHDVAGSHREFERALALEPQAPLTHLWYANTLVLVGDFKGALTHIDEAERLDPAMSATMSGKAVVLFDSGRAAEAVTLLKAVVAAQPDSAATHDLLARIYLQQGDAMGAVDELTAVARLVKTAAAQRIAKAADSGYREGGTPGMRSALLRQQAALFRDGDYSAYQLAQSYAPNDPDRAFALLEESRVRGESLIMALWVDPAMRPLHRDRRFAALLAELHLPGSPRPT